MQAQTTLKNTGIDTICKPVAEYKLIYGDALAYRKTDSLLKIAEAQLAELKNNISLLEEKDAEQKAGCQRQIDYLQAQITTFKDQVKGYELLVKKERRKRRLITGASIVTVLTISYLLIQK